MVLSVDLTADIDLENALWAELVVFLRLADNSHANVTS